MPQAVQASYVAAADRPQPTSFLDRIGIPTPLAFGFFGLLFFMIGDGVEAGYLSPFLVSRGISEQQVAVMFTVYGVVVAIAAWFSGALSDLWGPRQVMFIGLAVWAVFEVLFLLFGVKASGHPIYWVLLVAYGLRGFGYPLFAYGFLVWIAVATPPRRLGSACGWFWFAYTGGLPTLGSLLASFVIPRLGAYNTLWLSLGLVVLGGLIALLFLRERTGMHRLAAANLNPLATIATSVTILWQEPKTAIGAIVRTINTAAWVGFLVFMPIWFTTVIHFSLSEWLRLLSLTALSNIIWNLLFGVIGDKLGWRRTVAWCGGFGCAVTTLLFYYIPFLTHDYSVTIFIGVLYGATLAGYVPLSALMPSLAPHNKGAAMSALNLGAGASTWVGPAIAAIFLPIVNVVGVMVIYAGLYFISGIMALFLTLPAEVEAEQKAAATERRGSFGQIGFELGGSLLGHPPALSDLEGEGDIDLIFFDLGGTIYDDDCYTRALLRAVQELNPQVQEGDFWEVVDAQLGRAGSLRTELARRFVPGGDRQRLNALARQYWEYPSSALYPDAKPTLMALASRYKLGIVADSPPSAMESLRRDGLADLFTVVAISDIVGVEKPDLRLYRYALEKAAIPASRVVHVGNRLDNDVRPAQRLGIRTVWLLRGEVPPAPTLEQLAEPDVVITSLLGLPSALARLVGRSTGAEAAVLPGAAQRHVRPAPA
jgi:polyol permease family/HAD superfamily hydrolase (TIGR01549 family)